MTLLPLLAVLHMQILVHSLQSQDTHDVECDSCASTESVTHLMEVLYLLPQLSCHHCPGSPHQINLTLYCVSPQVAGVHSYCVGV